MIKALADAAFALEPTYLNTLESLVRLESPTHDRPAVNHLISHLWATLSLRGWAVERHTNEAVGDALIARKKGGDGPKSLLLTHCDTVLAARHALCDAF